MHPHLQQTMFTRARPLAFFACLTLPFGAWANEPLPAPEGEVLLRVTGMIDVTNADGAAEFDRAMLEALEQTEIRTRTIWTQGLKTFEGPTLAAVLDRVGATGTTVEAEALNDYIARIPMTDVQPDSPILALTQDGAAMPVRRKGPIWIIYPYDRGSAFQTDAVFARSVWQLQALHVVE